MTRIIAGSARGRRLQVPQSGTRPTSDRVRESIFSSLDHELGSWHGLAVLDLYAGTGAFALEALSRGAASALAVDNDADGCATIRVNAAATGLPTEVVRADARSWISARPVRSFDVVFLDPPYDVGTGVVSEAINDLVARGRLNDLAVVVVEYATRSPVPVFPPGFGEVADRRFGDTSVSRAVWYVSGNPN
ncbi:MAG: 16S rRNA (guanine(966)-N(2))-methyltransferase RsmD [Actinobacteria bacterium]|nr:16S rRNA (guanine(966)-N(2))-methyltransferase RsmD [Actinomycetota bacterium]